MKTSGLLYTACGLSAVQYGTHAVLFLHARPEGQLMGYGIIAILFGAVEIVSLFLAARRPPKEPVKPTILLWISANLAHAAIVVNYFFLLPALFDALVALALIAAFFKSERLLKFS